MHKIIVTSISNHNYESPIDRFHLDSPKSEVLYVDNNKRIDIGGWLLLKTDQMARIVIKYNEELLFFEVNNHRPDVINKILLEDPNNHPKLSCGFKFQVPNWDDEFDIGLEIDFQLFWLQRVTFERSHDAQYPCHDTPSQPAKTSGFKVMEGRHGWLFLDNDTNGSIDQFTGKKLISDTGLSDWNKYLKTIKFYSEKLDFKYCLLIVPAKEFVFKEYYPHDKGNTTPIDQLLNLFSADCNLIWPVESLINNRELSYWKGDSHWTDYGAFIASKQILQYFNIEINYFHKPLNFAISNLVGDLGSKFSPPKYFPTLVSNIAPEYKLRAFDNQISNHGRIWIFEPQSTRNLSTTCVIFGDSFAVNSIPWLAKFFKRLVYIHTAAACDYSILEFEKPSHVIFQTNSRFIISPPNFNFSIGPSIDSKLKLLPPDKINYMRNLFSSSHAKNNYFYSKLMLESIDRLSNQ